MPARRVTFQKLQPVRNLTARTFAGSRDGTALLEADLKNICIFKNTFSIHLRLFPRFAPLPLQLQVLLDSNKAMIGAYIYHAALN